MTYELPEDDPFQGSTGLKAGPAIVVESYFTKPPDYNQGKTLCLMLKKVFDDGEELIDRYPCGQDFDSFDDGETAEHPKDTEKRKFAFNVNSSILELVNSAFACGREVDRTAPNASHPEGRVVTDVELLLRKVSDDKYGGLGARAAGIWRGMKFQWEIKTETRTIRDRETQENKQVTSNRSLPVAFLGVAEVTDVAGNEFQNATQNVGNVAMPPPQPQQAPPSVPPVPSAPVPPPIPAPPTIPQPSDEVGQSLPPQPPRLPEPGAVPTDPNASPSAPPSPPQSEQGENGTATGVLGQLSNAETVAKIRLNAQTMPYHEWVDFAMAQPDVAANAEVVMALADENLYNALKTG